jgi:hypothetical protein
MTSREGSAGMVRIVSSSLLPPQAQWRFRFQSPFCRCCWLCLFVFDGLFLFIDSCIFVGGEGYASWLSGLRGQGTGLHTRPQCRAGGKFASADAVSLSTARKPAMPAAAYACLGGTALPCRCTPQYGGCSGRRHRLCATAPARYWPRQGHGLERIIGSRATPPCSLELPCLAKAAMVSSAR